MARDDDSARVARLFDDHGRRLYHLARRLSGSAEDARDLVQEAFLRVAGAPGRVPDGEPAGEAWLVRMVINQCRDRWRREAVRRAPRPTAPRPPAAADPEELAVARSTVVRILASLPPRRRAVVVLRYLEDRDTAEIAALLGVSQVTVRWHLAAARRQLARLLAPPAGEAS